MLNFNAKVEIRNPTKGEAQAINSLIIDVFTKCVAPDYSEKGVEFFLNLCKPEEVEKYVEKGNQIYIAVSETRILGVLWVRDRSHISRYFVDVSEQRKGIGRKLFEYFLNELKDTDRKIDSVTVNSSPFALKAYESLGFIKTDEEKIGNGMRYIPMVYLNRVVD